MLQKVTNIIFFRGTRFKKLWVEFEKLVKTAKGEFAEETLQALLKVMKFVFFLDIKGLKRNIENFNGRYLFRSEDDSITMAAIFKKGKMKVQEKKIDNTDITITFKNAQALLDFLFSPKPDILNAVLKQEVSFTGNLNYLSKFAYMATRLRLMATGKI